MGNFFALFVTCVKVLKYCIAMNGKQSDFFHSFRGVRQGENLSPVLFAPFLNDLEFFLVSKNCPGLDL